MAKITRMSTLTPTGLVVETAAEVHEKMVVSARSAAERRHCPLDERVHIRYA